MKKLTGISIYEDIVISKPYLKKKIKPNSQMRNISDEEVKEEINKIYKAVESTKKQISQLIDSLTGKIDKEELKILNVHYMILEDPVFISDIISTIKKEKKNSEYIIEKIIVKYRQMFKSLGDSSYSQRSNDIDDIGEKLLLNLHGKEDVLEDLQGKIFITHEVKPSDLLRYHDLGIDVGGIVTEIGGETSHVSILAKSLGIPMLIGVKGLLDNEWEEDKNVILDTRRNKEYIVLRPQEDILSWYKKELESLNREKEELKRLIDFPAETKDHQRIYCHANIGGFDDLEDVIQYNADGIGLLRTEFIYMESDHFPTEGEQFKIYKKIIDKLGEEKPLIIRTLDIGADKRLSYFDMPEEDNPFLGLRAIRLSLQNKPTFKKQLRAILRASNYGNIQIMYPMISSLNEILDSNKILDEVKKELDEEGLEYDKDIQVGIMVEIPSAAIMADEYADYVDFFSIGTNDLTQYLLAADRLSKEVAHIYNSYHPSVLKMINTVAEVGKKKNKKVSICGEMGSDPHAAIAFLSFGVTDLSMLASYTPKIKKIVKKLDSNFLKKVKKEVLLCKTSEEVKKVLNEFYLEVI